MSVHGRGDGASVRTASPAAEADAPVQRVVQPAPAGPPRPLVVVDIDGVLADVRHRQHHLAGPRKNWSAFFAEAADDPPIDAGVQAVLQAADDGLDIAYLTGRPEHLRAVTSSWLARLGLPIASDRPSSSVGTGLLHMRPHRDYRPAAVFKVEVLRALSGQRQVQDHWDDDVVVVDAVRRAGFTVTLVDWAVPRSLGLAQAQDALGRT